MSPPVHLSGIAWDHSRALPPLVATAQRFEETHPGVRIHWRKRTLDEFGHAPVDALARQFDLMVIDHPWAGYCFEHGLVHDLRSLLPAPTLAELEANTVGRSYQSYVWRERLLALPIDAATPVSSWRPDLLERAGAEPPRTWSDAVLLARRKLAVVPGFNADLFLHFLMLVRGLGVEPCLDPEHLAPRDVMRQAAELLRELTSPMPREIFDMNPIQVAERMAGTDDFAWNAFAYSYNNYARPGFAPNSLRFGGLVSLRDGGPRLRSVLGGTGIAISTRCEHVATALEYALFTAGGPAQQTIYLHAGGQPARREAWDDAFADRLCGGFFGGTRQAQEEAFVRPRYSGYVALQTGGGGALQEHLRDGHALPATLEKLDGLYRESRARGGEPFQTN